MKKAQDEDTAYRENVSKFIQKLQGQRTALAMEQGKLGHWKTTVNNEKLANELTNVLKEAEDLINAAQLHVENERQMFGHLNMELLALDSLMKMYIVRQQKPLFDTLVTVEKTLRAVSRQSKLDDNNAESRITKKLKDFRDIFDKATAEKKQSWGWYQS